LHAAQPPGDPVQFAAIRAVARRGRLDRSESTLMAEYHRTGGARMRSRARTYYLVSLAGLLTGVAVGVAADPPAQHPPAHGTIHPAPAATSPKSVAPGSLTLADLEQLALRHNPTLAEATAQVEASRAKALQAGLYPNPTVGYQGEQIGAGGTAGELQGGFIQQEIVTAGKLRLSRAKYRQEAVAAEVQALAQQYRVVNGVRVRFWDALTAQSLVAVRRDLLRIAEDAAQTTEQLVNVGQANRPDLLQARIESRRARVELQNAEQRYRGDWAQLIAVVGRPGLPLTLLAGQLDRDGPSPDWDRTLADLLVASPELQFAQAEVARDEITVRRERVEPIPNVTVRGVTGYNYQTRTAVAEAQLSVRLPIWDRNQGTIRQARADLARARANVTRVELSLRRRFADAATRYRTARTSVDNYRTETLPMAKEAYELLLDSYGKRRAAWPQVLVAARDYARFRVDYLEALHDLRRAEVEITGLLLVDGLSSPTGPTPQGHLEANPRPR
ncbi:MAG TPA: TolC family protein, partial [Fimbriiglobus sp.]|nr:TolC family protein [Fimbriiglobus sp.]